MEQADKELQELIDQGWIPIAGPNGLAGYSRVEDIRADFGADVFAPPPLADRDAPVYATTDGEVLVGYLTAAVGFVDLQTYDSPEFDADELREQAQYNPTPDELEALRFWIETLQHAAINE
ncbi:MAG: hypothetical protein EDR02_04900 [Actinobacteria bacterium]|nr:MAG: hypothetical protein EDR02_04900 [Actinomycetota bacterium]